MIYVKLAGSTFIKISILDQMVWNMVNVSVLYLLSFMELFQICEIWTCSIIGLSPFSRLHSNNLNCDCHLSWLSQWLRQRPTLGLFTQCSSPPQLRGINVAEIQKHEFSCLGNSFIPQLLFKHIQFKPSGPPRFIVLTDMQCVHNTTNTTTMITAGTFSVPLSCAPRMKGKSR